MERYTRLIHNDLPEVLEISIRPIVRTSDTKADGFLDDDFKNRELFWGITVDGGGLWWLECGSDPDPLLDDIHAAREWFRALGDHNGQDPDEDARVVDGVKRFRGAVDLLRCEAPDNEFLAEELDWAMGVARAILGRSIREEDPDNA